MSALLFLFVFLAISGVVAPEAHASGPTMTLVDGRLSLEAHDVPLTQVLIKIGESAQARVLIESVLASEVAQARVTMSFTRLPIDDALRRLLQGRNFVLSYGASGVDEIRVYVDGKTGFREVTTTTLDQTAMPSKKREPPPATPSVRSPDDPAKVARLRQAALGSPDAEARAEAFAELADIDDANLVVDTLIQALARERDSRVLEALMDVVEQQKDSIPLAPLLAFVTSDRDGAARAQALELFADRAGPDEATRSLLRTLASNDPSAAVREAAEGILDGLEAPRVPRAPVSTPGSPRAPATAPKSK